MVTVLVVNKSGNDGKIGDLSPGDYFYYGSTLYQLLDTSCMTVNEGMIEQLPVDADIEKCRLDIIEGQQVC